MKPTAGRFLRRVLGNGHVWVALGAGFFISCGLLMQHNGVQEFRFADGRFSGGQQPQTGSLDMLLWLGGITLALDVVSALLFKADRLQQQRAESGTGDTLLPDK